LLHSKSSTYESVGLRVGLRLYSYVETTTNTRKSETRAEGSYVRPTRLLNLIDRFLQYKKDSDEVSKKINAEGMTKKQSQDVEERKNKLLHEKDNIDAEKTKILNGTIFPAMASLTVLLEQMREHPNIREVFEDDVKELFLLVSSNKPGSTIFQRFVEACVCKMERGKQHKVPAAAAALALPPDFRAILGEYMQRAVFEMMKEMVPLKFEGSHFPEDVIINDMGRSIAWSKFFAAEAYRNLEPNLKPDKNGMPRGKHSRQASF